jgi:CheY-like chemotaxis protein
VSGADPLVLIVDDNVANRRLAVDVLRVSGSRTIEATSAAEAIARASAHLPDLILMDLRLPDLDGAEALRRLRAEPRTAGIPVVAVSATPVAAGDVWWRDAGFADYLVKPLDIDALADVVRRVGRGGPT